MSKARGLADLGNVYNDGALSNRNLIINGAMQVAQRGTSFTGVTTSAYHLDRFSTVLSGLGTHTVTQAVDGPDGFANSYKIEVTTADAAPAVSDYLTLEHRLEGQNLQQLKKGLASAESATVSFWVKSNKTGTYILEFDDNDNSRNINKAYTVDVSGAWEYKTITFAGDTTGAFDNDVSFSARLIWWLDAGANYRGGTLATAWEATNSPDRVEGNVAFGDTIGNTFQITGVQLEVGDTATPFEHRSYAQELALCQRYYQKLGQQDINVANGLAYASGAALISLPLITTMRAPPSFSVSAVSDLRLRNAVASSLSFTTITLSNGSISGADITVSGSSGLVAGNITQLRTISPSAYIAFDAEL